MDYASSYAGGSPRLDGRDGQGRGIDADLPALPAPAPVRMHWSTLLFVVGMATCAVALLVTVAGVPAALGYDVDGAPDRNKPDSSEPLALARSLDANMKWIDQASGDAPGSYVGYIKSINRSEAAIPAMVQALVAMNASVEAIDAGLADVGETTAAMGADLEAMAATSGRSADAMDSLGGDIGFLSRSMLSLAGSTQELTERMARIERTAGAIARDGTSAAVENTRDLNEILPDGVPVGTTTDGRPVDQAVGAAAGAGAGPAAVAPAGSAPVRGAQPARPLPHVTGAAQ